MKKLSYIIFATIILLVGCNEDLIDLENPNQYTEATYFKTADQCKEAVSAAYGGLYFEGLWSREWYFVFDLLGNEASPASPLQGTLAEFNNYQFDATNNWLNEMWQSLYRIVLRSNMAVTKIGEASEVEDEALKSRLIAEAKFLRGWAYFQLASLWGDVPLRETYEKTKDRETHNMPRTAKPEVLDFVETSLTEAIGDLPVSYSDQNVGRITKGAAQALLGKVYLYREKFDQAITEFENVEGSGEYALLDDYTHNFLSEYDNNKETVWEVQLEQTGGNPYWMFGGQEGWGGMASHSGRAMEYGWNDWANVYFSEDAVEAFRYDSAGTANTYIDPRASLTFYGSEEIGDTTYCDHCTDGPKLYPFNEQRYRFKKYNNYEYLEEEGLPQSSINGVVIRYADVLLMHAEALIRGDGSESEAIDLINQVRDRVGAYSYDLTEEDESALELLVRERRCELSGEQKRFFDLVRWGTLQETLNAEFGDQRVKAKHSKLPIPTNELDANKAIEVENNWN
ncbi:MAG: RagB/SusD family nutrient uptake outer membrane protein [Bacteroidales bacterium]|nr:RagB/SusD family nutrient uptake outer membrane protein [Bacteroidales bacterium]